MVLSEHESCNSKSANAIHRLQLRALRPIRTHSRAESPNISTMATTVDEKIVRATKFPPEFNQKVDMKKVNIEVMKTYVCFHYRWPLADRLDGLLAK